MSLANRALVALATIAVFVVGVFSMGQLRQELIPSMNVPVVAVTAADPGTSPEIVAERVTDPIESAVQSIDGVTGVTSTVSTGVSMTTVELEYGTDVDAVEQEISSAVNGLQDLPEDIEPQVMAGSFDDLPVIQLAVSGDGSEQELTDAIDSVLVPELSGIAEVRDVTVTGATEQQVVIEPDDKELAAAGLTTAQLSSLLQENGTVTPVGAVTQDGQTNSVQVGTSVDSVKELENLPIVPAAGASAPGAEAPQAPDAGASPAEVVHLGDVAEVSVQDVPPTSYSRLDGEPSLAIALTKTPDGNTVDVSHAVHDVLADVDDELDDAGVSTAVTFDQAPFIEESIEGLTTEGGLGLLFAVLVILVFLASLRATLVAAISIPLSLAVTFAAMNLTGYTLNILTLAAMTISIGRIVDDSIVVIENIKRHLSYGEDRVHAIVTAVREVGTAITSSTICTVAVFAPIALVGGMAGELFQPFAVTVAIAMGASLVVALVVVPVLAYWFIKVPASTDGGAAMREAAELKERRGAWQRAYVPSLAAALRRPVGTLVVAVALLAGTVALVPRMETNFIGEAGQDTLSVTQEFAPGTSLAAQDEAAKAVEDVLADIDGVETVQTTVGSADGMAAAFGGGAGGSSASFAMTLAEDADGQAVQDEVNDALDEAAPDGEITVAAGDAGFASTTVDLVVTAPDAEGLADAAGAVEEAVTAVDGVDDVTNNLAAEQTAVQVTVDRDAAAEVGLTEATVSGLLAGAMNESSIGTVDLDGTSLDVVVAGDMPETTAGIKKIDVPTAAGVIPLSDLVTVEEVSAPASVTRVDGERSATVEVTPAGQDLGSLTVALTEEIDTIDLPSGAEVTMGGVASDQAEAFEDLGLALLAAILIVYLVMVATFRSIGQPLILLVSVPFAATGALGALLLTGTPLDVAALIGLLMLVGIVVSNAIVLIDLINQYRADGRPLDEAVKEGARQRLRPIVMTAAATILALTPMAFGLTGGGAFISQPLALVVIGGLVSSTLLTLYVVPVIYTLFERRTEDRTPKRAARAARKAEKAQAKAAHAARVAQELAAGGR
ncbi:efflux RND transporter permease subunit [Promicromonospora iranensis]|uniref:HAE1 family hydrophobic/amphiphilic exporter-1 n=1 Tax=Promicromonospora iranensis TaxID=1105144 RepID=A0ABU2CHH1_9MICO|nr:efflux RND transporter permease subunit [Promicromonospora iranensis]MDR7380758.1 HAE1 family hydrophobic/amphiphilic exporter-1 [Promicromonospora iranensis]